MTKKGEGGWLKVIGGKGRLTYAKMLGRSLDGNVLRREDELKKAESKTP